jgi:hypothetical protein
MNTNFLPCPICQHLVNPNALVVKCEVGQVLGYPLLAYDYLVLVGAVLC